MKKRNFICYTVCILPIFSVSLLLPYSSQGFQKAKKRARRFHPIIAQAALHHKVDPALIQAIIMTESGFNPHAVSKKGAQGLMQLMPDTAEELGVKDPLDPEQNIHGGVRYFKELKNQFNQNIILALAAYHAGTAIVKRYGGVPQLKETRYFIERVLKYYKTYKNNEHREADIETAEYPDVTAHPGDHYYQESIIGSLLFLNELNDPFKTSSPGSSPDK